MLSVSATTTQNLLGKCKHAGCDYVIFATPEDVQHTDDWNGVRPNGGIYQVGNYGRFARCGANHKVFPVKAVKGTYSEAHKCDSRCLNARGWSCTCSCGGANHGRGHVATIVKASELPAKPQRTSAGEAKHIGQVGDRIRGEVEVAQVISLRNGNVLYVMHTVNGGHIIKWFITPEHNPHWEVGATFTMRAKVKSHGEWQGVPETVVIYAEEVE